MRMDVRVIKARHTADRAGDIVFDVLNPQVVGYGVLTDEHPASSYGVPVLLVGGEPVGPADLDPSYVVSPARPLGAPRREYEDGRTDEAIAEARREREFLARARSAGYKGDPA